jgi:hypothetical protein
LTRLGIQPCPVRVQEQVGLVAVKLRALMLLHGVLDGQRVQPELLAQHGQVAVVGRRVRITAVHRVLLAGAPG